MPKCSKEQADSWESAKLVNQKNTQQPDAPKWQSCKLLPQREKGSGSVLPSRSCGKTKRPPCFPRVAFRAYIVAACYSTEIR